MPKRENQDKGYLVAHPAGFPGVAIPLLSDEECQERGIEPGRFPPRDTWTPEQREAADTLVEILMPRLVWEVFQLMIDVLEHASLDSGLSEGEAEKQAATRALALVDRGKWKPKDTSIHLPAAWIRQVLESIARGKVSLTQPSDRSPRRRTRHTSKAKESHSNSP